MTDEQLIRAVANADGQSTCWRTECGTEPCKVCTETAARIVVLVAREMRERLAVWCSTMPLAPEDREKVVRRLRALPIPGECTTTGEE